MRYEERISKAFDYLRFQGVIKTQQDVANKMNRPRTNVSRAFNGDKRYLTEKFIRDFNKTFGGLFNEAWLLTGEGSMITGDGNVITGTASNNSGGTNIGVMSGDVINGTDPAHQERRDIAQEEHESDLLDTINALISIKTEQGVQEHELLAEIRKLRDVMKDIISMDGRYQQMLDVNVKLQEMNEKLLGIIDRLTTE